MQSNNQIIKHSIDKGERMKSEYKDEEEKPKHLNILTVEAE